MGGANVTPEEVLKQQQRDAQRLGMRRGIDIKACRREYDELHALARHYRAAGDIEFARQCEASAEQRRERIQLLEQQRRKLTEVKDAVTGLVEDMYMQNVVSRGGRAIETIQRRTPQELRGRRMERFNDVITDARKESDEIYSILTTPVELGEAPVCDVSDDVITERWNRLKQANIAQ